MSHSKDSRNATIALRTLFQNSRITIVTNPLLSEWEGECKSGVKKVSNRSFLRWHCLQVYMIGDPVQLPATVISKRAVSFDYDVSLFKRLQSAGYPVNVLDVQYRMHPDIARFPSEEFYQSKLKNGPSVLEDTARPWHAAKVSGFFFLFFRILSFSFCACTLA